jgi:hypothetical protein
MLHNFVHQLLLDVENVNAYGLFSFFIFFFFFTGVLVWVFGLKKNYINKMGDLPLDSGEKSQNSNGKI